MIPVEGEIECFHSAIIQRNNKGDQGETMIHSLVNQPAKYFDPFLDSSAQNFKTGAEIHPTVIERLLSSTQKDTEMFKILLRKE